MKLKNTHLLVDLVGQDPKKYSTYKKLILSDKSQTYSNNVKLNIDTSSGESFENSLSTICNSFTERKYLFFFPSVDNVVIEVSKENDLFEINYHIGYRGEIFTFEWYFKVGEGFVNVPKFNKELPIHLRMLLHESFKKDFVGGVVPNQPLEMLMAMSKILHKLLPTLVYIDLSKENVKLSYIEPNSKSGSVVKGDLLKNETNIGIHRVDSLWNVKHIGIGSFNVSGHFRLQKCGVGLSMVKLIYIEEFVKNQYIRRSTRELSFG
jgi:hypothetical protein